MMYSVQSPTGVQRFANLDSAVALCYVLLSSGAYPSLACADFRAMPLRDKSGLKWSLGFPRQTFKGSATVRAEQAGVRYVSHRRGYQASNRAFRRFCLSWTEFTDWCALPEIAAMRAANAGRCQATPPLP